MSEEDDLSRKAEFVSEMYEQGERRADKAVRKAGWALHHLADRKWTLLMVTASLAFVLSFLALAIIYYTSR